MVTQSYPKEASYETYDTNRIIFNHHIVHLLLVPNKESSKNTNNVAKRNVRESQWTHWVLLHDPRTHRTKEWKKNRAVPKTTKWGHSHFFTGTRRLFVHARTRDAIDTKDTQKALVGMQWATLQSLYRIIQPPPRVTSMIKIAKDNYILTIDMKTEK